MTNTEIYKRLLEVLKEDLADPALGMNELRNSQLETVAELMTDEITDILDEERQSLLESIEAVFHKD